MPMRMRARGKCRPVTSRGLQKKRAVLAPALPSLGSQAMQPTRSLRGTVSPS